MTLRRHEQFELARSRYRLAAGVYLELAVDVLCVRANRFVRDPEARGDLLEAQLGREKLEDAALRRRQRLEQPPLLEQLPQPQQAGAQDAGIRHGREAREAGAHPARGLGQVAALHEQLPNDHLGKGAP